MKGKRKVMKEKIDVFEYASHILKKLQKGVLITTKVNDKVNSMTISWGQLGIEWNKPLFTAFIRTGRFTHQMFETNQEFTVNIPMDENVGKILGYCGTQSGKDHDKIKDLGLTLVESDNINVPGIKELPLTLECKIVYSQLQNQESIPEDFKSKFYPQDKGTDFPGSNKDYHTMFMGEIVGAYIII
ncbi:MAG: flavin reductase family protein [Bacteroidales bacterium]